MNKLVRLSLTGGAECVTDAITLQDAIETAPRIVQEQPGCKLFDRTLITDEVAGVVYLLKDEQGQVMECRGDLEFMWHPAILPQLVRLLDSGSLTWQPFANIIGLTGRRVSALAWEPIPPS